MLQSTICANSFIYSTLFGRIRGFMLKYLYQGVPFLSFVSCTFLYVALTHFCNVNDNINIITHADPNRKLSGDVLKLKHPFKIWLNI